MHPRLKKVVIGIGLSLLVAACYLPNLDAVKFHGDEATWIFGSEVFEAYFGLQFRSPAFDESYWTLVQPPLARYIIGSGRRVGGYRWADRNTPWDWRVDARENAARGNMPSAGLLWWSRFPMALLAVLSVMIGFALVRAAGGQLAGICWVLLSCYSAFFLLHLRRAMGEASLLVCVALAALACYRGLVLLKAQPIPLPKVFGWVVLLGIAAGAAGAAKLNGMSVALCGGAVAILLALKLNGPVWPRMLCGLFAGALVTVTAVLVFEGLYPYLWPDPVGRTRLLLTQRLMTIEAQQTLYPLVSIDSLGERVQVVPYRVFETYAALPFCNSLVANGFFFLVGLFLMLIKAVKSFVDRSLSPAPTALMVTSLAVATSPLLTPLDWPRYYLLPVFFSTMFIAIGFAASATALVGIANGRQWRGSKQAPE